MRRSEMLPWTAVARSVVTSQIASREPKADTQHRFDRPMGLVTWTLQLPAARPTPLRPGRRFGKPSRSALSALSSWLHSCVGWCGVPPQGRARRYRPRFRGNRFRTGPTWGRASVASVIRPNTPSTPAPAMPVRSDPPAPGRWLACSTAATSRIPSGPASCGRTRSVMAGSLRIAQSRATCVGSCSSTRLGRATTRRRS